MKRYSFFLILILFLSIPVLLGAQEADEQDLPDETTILIEDNENPGEEAALVGPAVTAWDVIRMLLILALVLLVIYGIFHFMKKAGSQQVSTSELITVHGSQGLGGNKSIHLIETGTEFFLIGAGENSVNLIAKIEEKDAVDDLKFKISTASAPGETKNFSDIFSRLFKRGDSGVNLGNSMNRSRDFMKEQQERLKKM